MNDLYATPISQRDAFAFVDAYHRHHKAPRFSLYQVALARGDVIVGVAIVNRPVSRMLDDGATAEVSRLCTLDAQEARHAASKLYAMCWRIAREMGYRRLLTYTLQDETGVSLAAAGWREVYKQTRTRPWSHPSRPRLPSNMQHKTLWEVTA